MQGTTIDTAKPKVSGLLSRLLRSFTRIPEPPVAATSHPGETNPITLTPEVRASAHKDGLVLLHIPSGRVFLCNRTGARVWQGLSQGLNLDAIADEISREYGVPRDVVEQHTASFVTDLEQHGFVTRMAECCQ